MAMAGNHILFERQFTQELPTALPPGAIDESRAASIIAGNVLCQVVGTLIFFARAYSRLIITHAWKLEDSVLVASWVFATAFSACQYGQVKHGAGRHLGIILQNNPFDTVEAQKYAFAAQFVVLFALALPKYSICLTYLRIFHSDVWGRRMIKFLIFLVLVPIVPFLFSTIFQCKPIQVYWTEGRPASKCFTDISGLYINGGINVFVDLALMGVVLPQVLELHLNSRQRWALVGIVSLGSIAAVSGVIRMIRVGTTLSKPNFDATWDTYDISIWTSTEVYVSLICASAPGAKPLVSKLIPKLLGTTLSSRSKSRTTGEQGGSIELRTKRRATIGSARVRSNTHDTVLSQAEGSYTEVGRGVDRDSLDERWKGSEDSAERGIYKTSEISIQTSSIR